MQENPLVPKKGMSWKWTSIASKLTSRNAPQIGQSTPDSFDSRYQGICNSLPQLKYAGISFVVSWCHAFLVTTSLKSIHKLMFAVTRSRAAVLSEKFLLSRAGAEPLNIESSGALGMGR